VNRNPARHRNLGLLVGGAGLAVIGGALAWAIAADSGIAGALIALAIVPTLGGFIAAMIFGAEAGTMKALLEGRGVIARWQVGADRWAQFVALESRLAEAGGTPNLFVPRPGVPGIEVIIGEDAFLADGAVLDIQGGVPVVTGATTRFGPPLCLEIGFYFPADNSADALTRVLRLPVGAGADAEASAARAHFAAMAARAAAPSLLRRRPVMVRNAAIAVAIGCAAALPVGWSLLTSEDWEALALVLLLLGVMVTPAAALVAWLAHRRARG
jgi:hypothetical protein